jgi:hypothetical protein
MIGEKDGQKEWEMPDGRRVYAHAISVPIKPVERAVFEAATPARQVIEEYERLKFEPPHRNS